MSKPAAPPEFPMTAKDEDEYPPGSVVLRGGSYGHLEFELWGTGDDQLGNELYVGNSQQVGFVMSRKDALALAEAIRQHYGIKPDEPAGGEA